MNYITSKDLLSPHLFLNEYLVILEPLVWDNSSKFDLVSK